MATPKSFRKAFDPLKASIRQFYKNPFNITEARNLLLNKKLEKQDATQIMTYVKQINQQSPAIYKFYISGVARRGDEAELNSVLQEVASLGLAGDWRDTHAMAHASRKELQPALDNLQALVNENKASNINPYDFAFCVSKFSTKKEELEKFVELWDKMVAQGVRPNSVVLDAFIRARAIQGDEEGIRSELEKRKQAGLATDARGYAAIIDPLLRAGKVEQAQKWKEEMNKENLTPAATTYNALLDSHIKRKEFEEVEKLLEEMKRNGTKMEYQHLSFVVKNKIEKGDVEAAKRWLNAMMVAGWTPSFTLTNLVSQANNNTNNTSSPTENSST